MTLRYPVMDWVGFVFLAYESNAILFHRLFWDTAIAGPYPDQGTKHVISTCVGICLPEPSKAETVCWSMLSFSCLCIKP